MFLDANRINYAVGMQIKSYALLQWIGNAIRQKRLSFAVIHQATTLKESAVQWLDNQYLSLPSETRVDRSELPTFANMFCTYLENSFDLQANPGKVQYSPDCHCYCPMCSWLVDAPNLKSKKLDHSHKKRAEKMQLKAVEQLRLDCGLPFDETKVQTIVKEHPSTTALLAYGANQVLPRSRYFSISD